MIRLSEDERNLVKEILARWVPGIAVNAFGSRTRSGTKKWGDLDLAIMTDTHIPSAVMMSLKLVFSESDLPWRVDVIDWTRASESFKERIASDLTPL